MTNDHGNGPGRDSLEEELKLKAEEMGQAVDRELRRYGTSICFLICLYDSGPNGFATYVSNGERADTIRVIERYIATHPMEDGQ